MISDLLRRTLEAMAPNRSNASWLAGSVVLARLIDRLPNDIDIHHTRREAFERAMEKDTARLAEMGFSPTSRQDLEAEETVSFTHPEGNLTVNWVLEPEAPAVLVSDPLFGTRASLAVVIDRKIEMFEEDRDPKHEQDLVALLRHPGTLLPEIDPAGLRAELRRLGILPEVLSVSH